MRSNLLIFPSILLASAFYLHIYHLLFHATPLHFPCPSIIYQFYSHFITIPITQWVLSLKCPFRPFTLQLVRRESSIFHDTFHSIVTLHHVHIRSFISTHTLVATMPFIVTLWQFLCIKLHYVKICKGRICCTSDKANGTLYLHKHIFIPSSILFPLGTHLNVSISPL